MDSDDPERSVIDLRGVFLQEFEDRRRELEPCGRCQSDKDEKCVDRHLAFTDRFTPEDLDCGCGSWTRSAFRQQLDLDPD